ncbi:hypothetical protein SDC9_204539 [bioreactor metagenome]|uniref:Uncharacterized protein n=1 Tax=bioreactor metagenome TaxID=1076179 RepID=A0A645J070_9ZZZZ
MHLCMVLRHVEELTRSSICSEIHEALFDDVSLLKWSSLSLARDVLREYGTTLSDNCCENTFFEHFGLSQKIFLTLSSNLTDLDIIGRSCNFLQ